MSAVKDLEAKVTSLRDQLRDAELKWHRALMAEYLFQPGDVIEVPRKGIMLVSKLTVRYDEVRMFARKKTKSGWHGSENEVWAWGNDEIKLHAANSAKYLKGKDQ